MTDTKTTPDIVDDEPDSTQSRAGYNRSYYESNRDKLLTKKRERYASDPEYRAKLMEDSRRRRKSRGGPTISYGGNEYAVVRASDLADALGKSMSTINFWQRFGTIPETPFRSHGGYRLYTVEMVEGIKAALTAIPRPVRGDREFAQLVIDAWKTAGVPRVMS